MNDHATPEPNSKYRCNATTRTLKSSAMQLCKNWPPYELSFGATLMTTLTTTNRTIILLATLGVLCACGRSQLDDSSSGAPSAGCSTNADCPSGELCNLVTKTCVPIPGGCNGDADCAAPTPRCRVDTNTCVACVDNTGCPHDELCSNYQCVGYCGTGSVCANGLACCSPLCVDTKSDPTDCGGCHNVCGPYPNSTAICNTGTCALGGCSPGYADCDNIVSNGCETNIANDPTHCGSCSNDCALGGRGSSCSSGICSRGCGPNQFCMSNQVCCGNTCATTSVDNDNCGGCGILCGTVAHGSTSCSLSACQITTCDVGFANCNQQSYDGCETNTNTDPSHCGTCNNVCGANYSCVSGVCQPNAANCKIAGCSSGQTCCGVTCVDTNNGDLNNCGGCGDTCAAGTNACVNGACCTYSSSGSGCAEAVCSPPRIRCNNTCVDPTNDRNNCGGCTMDCPSGSSCVNSQCTLTCNGGSACSGSQTCCWNGCADTTSDPNNCGGCGYACSYGSSCVNSKCTSTCNGEPACTGTKTCCDAGCTDITSDANHCGACNLQCPAGSRCVNSSCTATCNGGPVCTGKNICCASGCADVTSDPTNCGGCNGLCAVGDTCSNGVCVPPPACNGGQPCATGQTCCSGIGCTNLTADPNHCGSCTTVCSSSQACVGGACATSEGALAPLVNPTYLSPGYHHYTIINIPAGVTVYVVGSGLQSGTLDLRSDGTIVVSGTIDVSGGPGAQSVISSGNTQLGRAGSGGYTGEPYQSAAPSAQCAFASGNPGQLGMGIQGSSGTCPIISPTFCTMENDPVALLWTSPIAQFGGGAGVFTGYRAYGSGGGGPAGGAPGALCASYITMYEIEEDCTGVSGGGGAVDGNGGDAGIAHYNGSAGVGGETQCSGLHEGVPPACVGGGGGGSIGTAAAADLGVFDTFQTGSGGGGGSADYLNRPVFGGTSGGGGGGGAVRLTSVSTITIDGQILANGGPGADANIGNGSMASCDPQPGAAGGGGSGGVIYLAAPTITVTSSATVSATGGVGGLGSEFATGGAGGSGGPGRIRLSVTPSSCKLSGSFNPPLAAGCTETNKVGATYIGAYPS